MSQKTIITHNYKETFDLGITLSKVLPNGSVVKLTGDLGAGKTSLVRGVAFGLEIKDTVQSPTFNIMKVYLKGNRPLIHIDAYRLAEADNLDIGLDEYIGYESGITMVEWPQYIDKLLPKNSINVEISNLGEDERQIVIEGEVDF